MSKLIVIVFAFSFLSYGQDGWTLQQCLDSSTANNSEIRQSLIDFQIADLQQNSKYVKRLPTVNGGITHGYNWGQTIDPFTNEFATDRVQYNSLYLNSSITLYSGFDQVRSARIDEQNLQLKGVLLDIKTRDIQIEVVSVFLEIIILEELIKVTEESLSTLRIDSEQLEQKVKEGFAVKTDTLKIQSQEAKEKYTLVQFKNEKDILLARLQQTIGVSYDSSFTLERNLNLTTSMGIGQSLEQEVSEISADIELLKLKRVKSRFSPSLILNGSLGSGYSENNQFLSPNGMFNPVPFREQINDNFYQSASLSLNIPIFNGNKTNLEVKIRQLEIERSSIINTEQELIYENRILLIKREVINNESLVQSALFLVDATRQDFIQTKHLWREGEVDLIDYLKVKNSLYQAESELTQAKYSLEFSKIIYQMTIGSGKDSKTQ